MSVVKRKQQDLAARAYENVRQSILQGRLPPGAPLSRRRVAEDLGMSAVPVGEALLRLENEGLLESRPRAGTRVRIPTPEEVYGTYVVREALETHSARLFAELARPQERKRLVAVSSQLDQAYEGLSQLSKGRRERHARVEKSHLELHMLIAKATACPELQAAIERSRVLLLNWMFMMSGDFETLPPDWHANLAEALAHGTPAEAAEAMRMHVQYRRDEVVEAYRALRQDDTDARILRGPQRAKAAAL